MLSEEVLRTLAEEDAADPKSFEDRRDALKKCLKEIPDRQRWFLTERYTLGHALDAIAGATGLNLSAVTTMLHRIRMALRDCIRRRLETVSHG